MIYLTQKKDGFVLMMSLVFMFVFLMLGLTIIQAATSSFTASVRQSYNQVAHIASKAAIDYAEEAFELDPNWIASPEQNIIVNSKYRVTIESYTISDPSNTDTVKRIQAYGRVYIPDDAATAVFVRDIKATVIRNGEVIVNIDPSAYDPVVWLDASEPGSLIKPSASASSTTQFISSIYGSSTQDVVEQRGSNASNNPGGLVFGSDDLEMSWNGSGYGHQSVGIRFKGLNAPVNAVVNEAYIQFTTDSTQTSGSVEITVSAIDNSNPPSWSGNYAVDTPSKTTATVSWNPPDWNVVGASSVNERIDVTPIVQEIINRSDWTAGNNIAFAFQYSAGSGKRNAEKGLNGDDPELFVEWSPGGAVSDQTILSVPGGGANSNLVEQRGSDANLNPGLLSFNSSDIEFSFDGVNRGNQSIGLRFKGYNAPQGATVTDSFIQLTTDETAQAGAVSLTVHGVDSSSPGDWSGYYAVDNAVKTTASVSWNPPDWDTVGEKGEDQKINVTAIVQEIVDRTDWIAGSDIAFTVQWASGTGVRTAESGNEGGDPEFYSQWSSGGSTTDLAENTGDLVGTWLDKSLNGNNATLEFGSAPALDSNGINGQNSIFFDNDPVFAIDFNTDLSATNLTAFIAMKARTDSSFSNARFLTAYDSSDVNDTTGSNSARLFAGSGTSTTLVNSHQSTSGEVLSGAIDDTWSVFSSRISSIYSERLIQNGTPDNYSSTISNLDIVSDTAYVGGIRNSNNTAAIRQAEMEVAEIIIYDKALVCSQIQNIEDYLGNKYAITVGTKNPCP